VNFKSEFFIERSKIRIISNRLQNCSNVIYPLLYKYLKIRRNVSKFSHLDDLRNSRIPWSSNWPWFQPIRIRERHILHYDNSECEKPPFEMPKTRNYRIFLEIDKNLLGVSSPPASITPDSHMFSIICSVSTDLGMTIIKRNFHRILWLITVLHSCIIILPSYSITGSASN